MKVGLITIYSVPNYGSVLQAYATQRVIEQMGYECVIIKYDYYREQLSYNKRGIKGFIKDLLLEYTPTLKTSKLRRFRNRTFKFSKAFYSFKELQQYNWDTFDAFVVGSDQVWNTNYLKGNRAFLLSFVPVGKLRLSFSSSFAMKELPDEYAPLFKEELSKFGAISVREQNGVNIINNELQLDKKVKVTLDPTLLLSGEQWNSLDRAHFKIKKPYILVYLWTYAFEPRPYFERVVEYFQKKTGYEVRVLEGHRHLNDLKVSFIDNNHSSVSDFLNLISNASLIITSSFHGTAFAVNFGIPLVSIVPDGNSDDRQSTLLRSLNLNNCIVRIGDDMDMIMPNYDVREEQTLLSELRNDSLMWLSSNLSINDY